MDIQLVEVTSPSLAYIVFGGFTVAFSMMYLFLKEKVRSCHEATSIEPTEECRRIFKLYINEVFLGTAWGVMMGPHGANLFDPRSWNIAQEELTLEVMRVVLVIGLFIIGVELPNYMSKHIKGLLVMVIPTMAIGWVIIAGFLKLLFPQFDFISCLAISACLTPTDPIICAAIVGGRIDIIYGTENVRNLLSAESAANDGLAFPFLTIALYLTLESSKAVAIEKWFLIGWLYQVILGVVLGVVLGTLSGYLMKLANKRDFVNTEAYLTQLIAVALLTTGIATTIGTDELLAAFAAGIATTWAGDYKENIEGQAFAPVIDFVLNCACFLYIGAWLPFDSWHSDALGLEVWRLIILLVAVLVLRRIPALLLLYRWVPEINDWKEAIFSGHFGPMGVSAVFVSSLAVIKLPEPGNPPATQAQLLAATIQPIVSFVVLGSIIVHGLSVALLSLFPGLRKNMARAQVPTIAQVEPRMTIPRASIASESNTLRSASKEYVKQG